MYAGNITYSCGNTKITRSGSAEWRTCYSTLAMSTGKYYALKHCQMQDQTM